MNPTNEELWAKIQELTAKVEELKEGTKPKALPLDGLDRPQGACELIAHTETLQINTEGTSLWLPNIEVDLLLISTDIKRCEVYGGIIGAVKVLGETELEFWRTVFLPGCKSKSTLVRATFVACEGSLPL